MNLAKFKKMLRHAHAGELAAYHAYEGHWRSQKNPAQREMIKWIQAEELEHVHQIEVMLYLMRDRPSRTQHKIYCFIGKTLSKLCFLTGTFLPNLGALLIENIGVTNYEAMIKEANNLRLFTLSAMLSEMWQVEKEHQEYFRTCLRPKEVSGRRSQK